MTLHNRLARGLPLRWCLGLLPTSTLVCAVLPTARNRATQGRGPRHVGAVLDAICWVDAWWRSYVPTYKL